MEVWHVDANEISDHGWFNQEFILSLHFQYFRSAERSTGTANAFLLFIFQ